MKEEWKILKPSLLRYHRELRKELGEGWTHSLGPELGATVQRILGEDWKEKQKNIWPNMEEEEWENRLTEHRAEEESIEEIEEKSTETKPERRRS